MLFGVTGMTSDWSRRHGTFDFSGEVRFAQWRESHPDRSNLVASMVCVSGDGSLDIAGFEFGVCSFWLAISSLVRIGRDWSGLDWLGQAWSGFGHHWKLRFQAWFHPPAEATALHPFWLASSIVTRRCDRLSGACQCLWRYWCDFALGRTSRHV